MHKPKTQMMRVLSNLAAANIALALVVVPGFAGTNKQHNQSQGIWKAVVPPGGMKGEFDNHDPIGLATGAKIKVDCSLNWPNPDTGKIYCFNSPTSLVYFLDWPKKNIENATKAWKLIRDAKQNKK